MIYQIYLDLPSFSWKWGMGKLNQIDGQKGLLKWGTYTGAAAGEGSLTGNPLPPEYPEGWKWFFV